MSSPAADDLTITAGQWVGARTLGGTLKLSTDTVEFVPHAFDRTFGGGNPLRARAGDVDGVGVGARTLPWFVRRLEIRDTDGTSTFFQVRRPTRKVDEVLAWAEARGLAWRRLGK